MKKSSNKNTKHKPGSKVNKDSPEEKHENERPLPGEYPPSEDIMDPTNEMQRIHVDLDSISTSRKAPAELREEEAEPTPLITREHNEADLTREDFEALGPRDLSMDMGADEELKHRPWPVDFAANDLDVPSGDTDKPDALGQGDEENDHYSLGGDRHENLEEDSASTS